MNLGSPVSSPVHLGAPPSYPGYQSPAQGLHPQFHSTMVAGGAQGMTPLGQSPVVAGSQMQQTGNAGQPGFLPGYLMGSFPQQVRFQLSGLKIQKQKKLTYQPLFSAIKQSYVTNQIEPFLKHRQFSQHTIRFLKQRKTSQRIFNTYDASFPNANSFRKGRRPAH